MRKIKDSNLRRFKKINSRIINLGYNIVAREFPIYVRYLKDDDIFALLYAPSEEYFEVGFNINKKISSDFIDASWMKYDNIKYSVRIYEDTNIDKLFNVLNKYFKNEKNSKRE